MHGAEELDCAGLVETFEGWGLLAGSEGGEVGGLDVGGLVDTGGDAVGEKIKETGAVLGRSNSGLGEGGDILNTGVGRGVSLGIRMGTR